MLCDKQILRYLGSLEKKLISNRRKRKIYLTNKWAKDFPEEPGVYVAFENDEVVYVGETNNIQRRMNYLRFTYNHSLRLNIGRVNFSKVRGYRNATAKKKFPSHIEEKVNDWLTKRIKISILPTKLGRKELESRIIDKYNPKYKG